jgi:hypothetical protein
MAFRRAVLEMKRAHTLGGGYGQAHGGASTVPFQAMVASTSGIAVPPVRFGASDFAVRGWGRRPGFGGCG